MTSAPLLDYAIQAEREDRERLKRIAASGSSGLSRQAQAELRARLHADLKRGRQ